MIVEPMLIIRCAIRSRIRPALCLAHRSEMLPSLSAVHLLNDGLIYEVTV